MSICKSRAHIVQVTLHGVTSPVPMNQDYKKVVLNRMSLRAANIPQIFDQKKDEYYRSVLSEVGKYRSGVDYKHYDDKRCKCILCWTFRNGFEFNYPTVRAKLLCVKDQLKNEDIHRNMRYDVFKKLVYSNAPGIQPRMVDFLWNSLFKGRPRDPNETFDLQPEVKRILSSFDILELRRMDESGRGYPDQLQDGIKELQKRVDKQYEMEQGAAKICNMTKSELFQSHRNLLKSTLTRYRQNVDVSAVESLWKQRFLHDYLLKNMSKSRVEKTEYEGFRNIRRADKRGILNVDLSEYDATISAAKTELYLLDPLVRVKVEEAYKKFNDQFRDFLTDKEKKNFKTLLKSRNIKNQLSREYRVMRVQYEFDYLRQLSQGLVRDVNDWWIPVLKNTLDLIDKENEIHRFGFQSNVSSRLNCRAAVREYVETTWQSIRDGEMEYTNSMGQRITPQDFQGIRLRLYRKRMREHVQAYVDNNLVQYYLKLSDTKKRSVDKKMTRHMLRVVIEFMQRNDLKTRYREDNTLANFKRLMNYGTELSSGLTPRQEALDAEFKGEGGYEEQQRLRFYIDEFSKDQRVKTRWNVVSWYVLREKNHMVWQWSYDEFDMGTKKEMLDLKNKCTKEAEKSDLADKINAEMYLMFDIFNSWDVDGHTLDRFISKNLPPRERYSFDPEMRRLKSLLPNPQVQARIEYLRSAYKKIIFDKEIVKRATILSLKKENERIRQEWDEEVLDGRRTWGLSELQNKMQQDYSDYLDMDMLDRFPYDREWIVFKYRNVHKWLTVNAKVFVFCKFADVVEKKPDFPGLRFYPYKGSETEPDPSLDPVIIQEDGYWMKEEVVEDDDTPMLDPSLADAMRRDKENLPTEWSDADRKTEDLLLGWVEGIDTDFVSVRLERSVRVSKLEKFQDLELIRVDMNKVYDSVLDYNLMRERDVEQQRQEKKTSDELKRLKELDRQRRDLIRKISVVEATEEEKAAEEMERAAKNALLMFDESKSEERRRLFNEWMEPIRAAGENGAQGMSFEKYKRERVKECIHPGGEFKPDGKVKIEMFKRGRKQWIEEFGLDAKFQYNERLPRDNMRTKEEQRDYTWSLGIIDMVETAAKRVESNKFTNEYMKFMYMYPRNGSNADIKQFILEKMEDMTPDAKRDFMEKYKEGMNMAVNREDKRLKKEEKLSLTSMNTPGSIMMTKPSRFAIRRRRDELFDIIDSVIEDIEFMEEDPRLDEVNDEEVRMYILSGKLSKDADIRLKTPKFVYTDVVWISEVEKSLRPLDNTTFTMLVDYVTVKPKVSDYQNDFRMRDTNGKPVYPTPDNDTLKKLSQSFKPPNSNVATSVRVGMGPGSWFKIDPRSELMRQTNMSMEDRLLFAEDVKVMREETNSSRMYNEKYTKTRLRMNNVLVNNMYSASDPRSKWIDSDGDGSIRIVDDFVGIFYYDKVTYTLIRKADDNDIPTHLRLNSVYFDTVRGREGNKAVRRLVPFYVVSLYKKEDTSYRRLKVRNRAHKTFLPRQKKLNKLYSNEDYKGYECSVCLSQGEFDALTNGEQMTPGVDRRILQIPGPFLYKYHKILYSNAKEIMEEKLINAKTNSLPLNTIKEDIVSVAEPDDMAAPFSDGMIRLGSDIQAMSVTGDVVQVDERFFDVDGNLVSSPELDMDVQGDKVVSHSLEKRLPYKIELYSIHSSSSSSTIAVYGKQPTSYRFVSKGVVYVCTLNRGQWRQKYIADAPQCSMMKWCGKKLLVVGNDVVKGYDMASASTLTLKGHMNRITCIGVKNNKIVTGSTDNTLIVWKSKEPVIAEKSRVLITDAHVFRFGDVKQVVSGSVCQVDLFKTDRKKVKTGTFECTPSSHVKTLYGHTNAVQNVVWGKYIVSSSTDKTIIVWKKYMKLFQFDFMTLNLADPLNDMSYKSFVGKDSQPHLQRAFSSGVAPFIALCTPTIMFYGIGSVLGKMDIEKGTRVSFKDTIVNSVSELPTPDPVSPDVEFFNEDGTLMVASVYEAEDVVPFRTSDATRWLKKIRRRAKGKRQRKRERRAKRLGLTMPEYMWRVLVLQFDDLQRRKALRTKPQRQDVVLVDDRSDSGWSSEDRSIDEPSERDELLDEEGFEDYDDMEIVDIVLPYGK